MFGLKNRMKKVAAQKAELAELRLQIDAAQKEEKKLRTANIRAIKKAEEETQSLIKKAEKEIGSLKAQFDDGLAYELEGEYRNRFSKLTSAGVAKKLAAAEAKLDRLERNENAFYPHTQWEINGSSVQGTRAVNNTKKAMIAYYRSMVDDTISKITWRNGNAKLNFIHGTAVKRAETLGKGYGISFTSEYIDAHVESAELIWQNRQNEQEERERIKEEARSALEQRKLEMEVKKAHTAEQKLQAMLDAARAEGGDRIAELEAQLAEAHSKTERAKSMAEQTKRGWVYIISNEGAFGSDVVKIGLTRRLDPFERINELGDASVPFKFDTHALIYCEDAPALERKLHEMFRGTQVNVVNNRKEFFRIDTDTIKKLLAKDHPDVRWMDADENSEYRHTLAITPRSQDITFGSGGASA